MVFRRLGLAAVMSLGAIAASAANKDPATLKHKAAPAGYVPVAVAQLIDDVFAANPV